jgi:hypothetical protein
MLISREKARWIAEWIRTMCPEIRHYAEPLHW